MKIKALLICFMVVIAGCASKSVVTPPYEDETTLMSKEIYKIGVGDTLNVSVWKNPELSVIVPVRPDGMISVPLIGDIQAAGHPPQELAQSISDKLGNYVRNPQVTIVVTNAASGEFLRRVRVTGAVQTPSSLPYQKGMTVMDVVLVSGGLTPFADPNGAKLYRVTEGASKVYPIKLKDVLEKGDIKTNYKLMPGDIVTIPEKLF